MSTEQITIRLPVQRVAALKAAARAEHRSLAQQVEHMLALKFDAPSREAVAAMQSSPRPLQSSSSPDPLECGTPIPLEAE